MENSQAWRKKRCPDNSRQSHRGHGQNNGGRQNNKRNNKPRSAGSATTFRKFVDPYHNKNQSNNWSHNDWNHDNRNNQYIDNGAVGGSDIYPWIRKAPINHLIFPVHHKNFDQHEIHQYQEKPLTSNNIEVTDLNKQKSKNQPSVAYESVKENAASTETTKLPAETNFNIENKQKKDLIINLKSEPKSSSSSSSSESSSSEEETETIAVNSTAKKKSSVSVSPANNHVSDATETTKIPAESNLKSVENEKKKDSSSSESSSSEEETQTKTETIAVKKAVTPITNPPPSLPLNIKLKSKSNVITSTPVKSSKKQALPEQPSKSSSSSASSSDEESKPSLLPITGAKASDKQKLQIKVESKTKSTKKKNSSEDDVVCIGALENKIILEDESDNKEVDEDEEDNTDEETIQSKKSTKNTLEKCMICDKKGHSSFQCQMICKNCSAPYHGYRTCPQPANLNTMFQLFMEFCMQQFQNFSAENPISKNSCESVPKPQIEDTHSMSISNKSNKLKRKKAKLNKNNTKSKATKKRKISTSTKKKSKTNSDDSSDEEDNDDADTETCSTESENTSDSPAESLVSSKKKHKIKEKVASKASLPNLLNFSTNPANLPMVLNSCPSLTFPTSYVQNQNTSANALNTLLLQQMFQNAIGSLKQ